MRLETFIVSIGTVAAAISACSDGTKEPADSDADADTDSDSDTGTASDTDSGSDSSIPTGCGGSEPLDLEVLDLLPGQSTASEPLPGTIVIVDCAAGRTEGVTDAEGRVSFSGLDYAGDPPDVTFWAERHTIETIQDFGRSGGVTGGQWALNRFYDNPGTVAVTFERSVPGSAVLRSYYGGNDATFESGSNLYPDLDQLTPFRLVGLEYEVPTEDTKVLVSFDDEQVTADGDDVTLVFPVGYSAIERFDVTVSFGFSASGPFASLRPRTSLGDGALRGAAAYGLTPDGNYGTFLGLTESAEESESAATYHVAYADEAEAGVAVIVSIDSAVAEASAGAIAELPLAGDPIVLDDPPALDATPGVPVDVTSTELVLTGAPWANWVWVHAGSSGLTYWRVFVSLDDPVARFVAPPTGFDWGDVLPASIDFSLVTSGAEYDEDPWGPHGFFGDRTTTEIRWAHDASWVGTVSP